MQQVQRDSYWSGPLPYDQYGFVHSFDIHNFDPVKVQQFYEEYGLVVFDNVLNKQQIDESISNMWDIVELDSSQKIKRNDVETWDHFKRLISLSMFGFVGEGPFIRGDQLWKNRHSDIIYKAFKTLYELSSGEKVEEPMLAMFDRGSILRPSGMNQYWQTGNLPHFDINPWQWTETKKEQTSKVNWKYNNRYDDYFLQWLGEGNYVPKVRNFTKLQGVLGLSNTNKESGGFQAVCGFHKHIKRWCQNTKYNQSLHSCPDLLAHMQMIHQRAGSICIFNRELPHGITSNTSKREMRYAQYLRMGPESTLMLTQEEKANRKEQVRRMLPQNLKNSEDPIARELYMLD